ncbi:ABC transporter substrate-binding protein [Nonomuraea lactucae]|uniref:ABC transporter substrate-binding protein n=1 Tax=Nonomuraea lactucae TaxID=2249762 RepID=UPI000DE28FD4|nr:ABC transporter substrate-binding protein [Nonomuraea lactucae]
MRTLSTIAGLAALALTVTACGGGATTLAEPSAGSGAPTAANTIVIGTANFTENVTLGHVYAGLLKSKGYEVTVKPNLGSREVIFPALQSGDIDMLPEYQGSLLLHLDKAGKAADGDAQAAELKAKLPAGLKLLPYAPAQDKTIWMVTRATADKHGLKSLDDLKKVTGQLVYGGPPEDKTRRIGLVGLKEVYGTEFKTFRALDAGGPLTKAALRKGDIDLANIFSSDAEISANDWVGLEDPQRLQPDENVAPLVREQKADAKLTAAMAELNAKLTTEELIKMNHKTDVEKEDPEDVANAWLKAVGLVS